MISIWNRRNASQTLDPIDQTVYRRNYRVIAGLSLDSNFDRVRGALLVCIGHGKFIRLRSAIEKTIELPAAMKKSCLEYASGSANDLTTFHSLLSDLAAIQSAAVEKLKIEAGKYVDRILAVAVVDPGLWRRDFDGRITYAPFCDATRLAELCAISVIDSFPAADLAVGGQGTPLDPLPWWLLAADRDRRIARSERWILRVGHQVTLLRLPFSDGLDAELPNLELWQLKGKKFERWQPTSRIEFSTGQNGSEPDKRCNPSADSLSEALTAFFRSDLKEANDEIICVEHGCASKPPSHAEWAWQLPQFVGKIPNVKLLDLSQLGFTPEGHSAVVAAVLGLTHIDQLPTNVPWLTGSEGQRILGRLTLGRPSNWRQLVRAMADYQPAAMKLRDAV